MQTKSKVAYVLYCLKRINTIKRINI